MKLAPQRASRRPILDNSTILLPEKGVESFFKETVVINLLYDNMTDINDFKTKIKIFGIDTSCKNIAGTDFAYYEKPKFYITEKNISDFHPIYALEGSTFQYHISSNDSTSKYVKICMYLGVHYEEGRELYCQERLLRWGEGQFKTQSSEYVFFKVKPHDDVQYFLSINATVTTLQGFDKYSLDCDIDAINQNCSIKLPFKLTYCLLAKFYPNVHWVNGIELQVDVKDSRFFILPPSLVIPVLILIIIIIIVFYFILATVNHMYYT